MSPIIGFNFDQDLPPAPFVPDDQSRFTVVVAAAATVFGAMAAQDIVSTTPVLESDAWTAQWVVPTQAVRPLAWGQEDQLPVTAPTFVADDESRFTIVIPPPDTLYGATWAGDTRSTPPGTPWDDGLWVNTVIPPKLPPTAIWADDSLPTFTPPVFVADDESRFSVVIPPPISQLGAVWAGDTKGTEQEPPAFVADDESRFNVRVRPTEVLLGPVWAGDVVSTEVEAGTIVADEDGGFDISIIVEPPVTILMPWLADEIQKDSWPDDYWPVPRAILPLPVLRPVWQDDPLPIASTVALDDSGVIALPTPPALSLGRVWGEPDQITPHLEDGGGPVLPTFVPQPFPDQPWADGDEIFPTILVDEGGGAVLPPPPPPPWIPKPWADADELNLAQPTIGIEEVGGITWPTPLVPPTIPAPWIDPDQVARIGIDEDGGIVWPTFTILPPFIPNAWEDPDEVARIGVDEDGGLVWPTLTIVPPTVPSPWEDGDEIARIGIDEDGGAIWPTLTIPPSFIPSPWEDPDEVQPTGPPQEEAGPVILALPAQGIAAPVFDQDWWPTPAAPLGVDEDGGAIWPTLTIIPPTVPQPWADGDEVVEFVPPPEPPATGGGYVSDRDVRAIERLLYKKGIIRAVQQHADAHILGTIRNPEPREPERQEQEPPATPPARNGSVVAEVAGAEAEVAGYVGFSPRDEAIAVAAALNDPLVEWLRRELGL